MNNSTSSEQAKIDAEIAVAATRTSVKNAAQSVTDSASAVKEQAKEKMAEFKFVNSERRGGSCLRRLCRQMVTESYSSQTPFDRNPTTNANAAAGICCRLFAHRFACDIY